MPTICTLCSMRHMLDPAQPSPLFEETAEEHLTRCHPDPVAKQQEEEELDRRLADWHEAHGHFNNVPRK